MILSEKFQRDFSELGDLDRVFGVSIAVGRSRGLSFYFLYWYFLHRFSRIYFVPTFAFFLFLVCFSCLFSFCLHFVIAIHTFRMV